MLASHYEQHWGMQLEPEIVTLVAGIAADARTSFTGPQSLRRVAERLVIAAGALTSAKDDQFISANRRQEIDRCVEALRCISERLVSIAIVAEEQKICSRRASEIQAERPALPPAPR
jgi:hypothetical protein